ncbi:MAG TPA: pilus assembly protein [Pseudoxanthomonas sp.]|uniref:Pilus assembly protein n=1 Tax=Pseudoxanthomonas helianthi TaxID=1453541 RepID=A0A941AVB7_9GAMM|nr:pilus assembly protein [Pseudoxanthomonas helianthi]MBP3983898.1 pilus assembly protein [Pseudoxanthomonas helianthi]HWU71182.1 pilus assembly protein [Pseudoxanthomonas sp.]
MKRSISLTGRRSQRGQGMTEYIIIVALIAIAAIGVFTFFGGTVRGQAAGIAKELSGQSATQSINRAKNQANSAQSEADKTKGMDAYKNK